jgi:hypothetical protein
MLRRDLSIALLASATGAALTSPRANAQSCTPPCYAQTSAEAAAGITPSNTEYPFGDMRRYGVQTGASIDNTSVFAAVFGMFKTAGGTIIFQPGQYAGYVDLSGTTNAEVIVEGNGASFCYPNPMDDGNVPQPPQSCVLFANNSGVQDSSITVGTSVAATSCKGTNFEFRNCNFYGQLISSTTQVNAAAAFYGANAKFWNCQFNYGEVSAFYGCYAQYTEFWSCQFNLSASSLAPTGSFGCILDSHTVNASTNEVLFQRCEFFSNANGLWLKGTITTRIRDCTFEGQTGTSSGCAALRIDADSTGSEASDTIIDGCWFEDNLGYHIYEVGGIKTRLVANQTFASGGQNEIYFTHCDDLVVLGHNDYDLTLTFSINHPNVDTDTTRLTWHGNNITPIVSVVHNGPQCFDVSIQGSFTWTMNITGSPSGTCYYSINGDAVTLTLEANITGSVNTANPVLAGAPSLLTPARNAYLQTIIENVSTVGAGLLGIDSAGLFELDATLGGGGFSAGTGGVVAQTFAPYRLST